MKLERTKLFIGSPLASPKYQARYMRKGGGKIIPLDSPVKEDKEREKDKRLIAMLIRQNSELMEHISKHHL